MTVVHEYCTLLSQKPGEPISDHYWQGGPVLLQITAHSFTSLKLYLYTCTIPVRLCLHSTWKLHSNEFLLVCEFCVSFLWPHSLSTVHAVFICVCGVHGKCVWLWILFVCVCVCSFGTSAERAGRCKGRLLRVLWRWPGKRTCRVGLVLPRPPWSGLVWVRVWLSC